MYTIKQAALRSGVNVPLLRQWERRYGVVAPTRTETGYRLYDDDAIERLRAMRTLVDQGWSPRQAAERITAAPNDELAGLAPQAEPPPADDPGPVEAFIDAATRIDAGGVEQALDEMFARSTFERAVEDQLFPALQALGEAWATGDVDVAGEHTASAAVVRRLSMAFEAAATTDGDRRPILVGLPPGSRHELAALAFATAARRARLPVVYLGPDVPAGSWVAAVERTNAQAVAFGIILEADLAAAEHVVAALRDAHPGLLIAVGGRSADRLSDGHVLRLPDALVAAVEELSRAVPGA